MGFVAAAIVAAGLGGAAADERASIKSTVDEAVGPVMQKFGVPGMAVGIVTKDGQYVFDYGVASKETGQPVTDTTLFEIGSVTKTFTATLAAYAQIKGHLQLADSVSKHLTSLRGSSLDQVTVLQLATHTPGGFPLQVPDEVTDADQLMAYFRNWKPAYAPGTTRTYSNPSVALLGMVAAKSMNGDFAALLQGKLFAPLGMSRSFLAISEAEQRDYAQGYTKTDAPVRMSPGVIASEAYGLRMTAGDLLRFVQANMGMLSLDAELQQAITATHTGYFRVGEMTQDLIWEQYAYPAELTSLLAGNSAKIALEPNAASAIDPTLPPREGVLINKTGSTNGFGAYVAFVPAKKIGVVLLANKNYPIEARVTAAHRILTGLDANAAKD